jgi:hypothetical protein
LSHEELNILPEFPAYVLRPLVVIRESDHDGECVPDRIRFIVEIDYAVFVQVREQALAFPIGAKDNGRVVFA